MILDEYINCTLRHSLRGQGTCKFKALDVEDTDGELEGKIVRPVEATLLGLAKDTVYWQRGLLASPTVFAFLCLLHSFI